MEYRVIRTEDLEHGLLSKAGAKLGSTWDKHKYIAKEKVGNGYRYFYSQAELAAAKAKKASQKVAGAAKSGVAKVKKSAADVKRYASDVNNTRSRYKEAIAKEKKLHTDAASRKKLYESDAEKRDEWRKIYAEGASNARMRKAGATNLLDKIVEGNTEKAYSQWYTKKDDEIRKIEKQARKADKVANIHEENLDNFHDSLREYNKSVNDLKYGAGIVLNAADKAINKGKSAASKLLSNAKSAASSTIRKGKRAVDNLINYAENTDKRAEYYDTASTKAGNQKDYERAEKLQGKANEAEDVKSSAKYKVSQTLSKFKRK